MDVTAFKKLPIMGILRGIAPHAVAQLTETVLAAGLYAIEITMNTEDAPELIRSMTGCAEGRLAVGAGTVLNRRELDAALDAGATFIVTPCLIEDVTRYCAENAIPIFPGALTPGEIYQAWHAGATMVKLFPARVFGPSYVRDIHGPFKDIDLLACGGITTENIAHFFRCGASAASFGASIFRNEWITNGYFERIGTAIQGLITAYRAG